MTGTTTIPRVTVLHGHTTPETAYVVDDYPYGFRLRCTIRYWVETAEKGAKKGQSRLASQTTNPKRGDVWNKPKYNQYSPMVWLVVNAERGHVHEGHVHSWSFSEYGITPEADARTRLSGVYEQLTDDDRQDYDGFLKLSQRYANPWEEWAELLDVIGAAYAATGHMPERDDRNRVGGEGGPYASDHLYETAVAWVAHHAQPAA